MCAAERSRSVTEREQVLGEWRGRVVVGGISDILSRAFCAAQNVGGVYMQ